MRGRGRGKASGGGGIGKKIEEQGKKTSTGGLRKPWGDLVRRQRGGFASELIRGCCSGFENTRNQSH